MSDAPLLLAEFRDPGTLLEAARRGRDAGLRGLDAHVPFAVEGLPAALGLRGAGRIRFAMLLGGLGGAALAYGLQWYSATRAYPFLSGGRPLHAWPAFLIPSFEAGVLFATLAGLLCFLLRTGLPHLHHPAFAAPGFARASQDRFFLAVDDPAASVERLAALLDGLAPLEVREVARP